MVESMKDNGKTTSEMEEAMKNTLILTLTRENSKMERHMDMEYTSGARKKSMMDSGRKD